jgi:hypothetical protein
MKDIIIEGKSSGTMSLYYRLVHKCRVLKNNTSLKIDVGSGVYPSHQELGNKVFTDTIVLELIQKMDQLFTEYTNLLQVKKRYSLKHSMDVFTSLKIKLINSISGIDDMSSTYMISLSSLLGLLPLDFYTSPPTHLFGSENIFWKEEMNLQKLYHKSDGSLVHQKVSEWTSNTLTTLQQHFTSEFTLNMLHSAASIISSQANKKDVIFSLPWFNKSKNTMLPDRMQLCFRIKGYRKNDWHLEVFDGTRHSIVFSKSLPQLNKIKYSKTNGYINRQGHEYNSKWLDSLYQT